MKRFWIGLCVLALLLATGLWSTNRMVQAHAPISDALAQASQAALTGNWKQATVFLDTARRQWENWVDFSAAFTDHSMLENAEGLFAELGVYEKSNNLLPFAAGCVQLSQLIRAIAESHLPNWQNLL